MMKTIKIYLFIAFLPFICKGQNISILDENTSEKFNFQAVEFWHDGSKMNDDKIDNVIYLKNNGLYYKRIFQGKVNVKWFGAKGDNKTNDTEDFRKALEFLKKSRTPSQLRPYILFVPRGDYIVDQVVWDYDGFQMEGEGPFSTMFKFTNKMKNAEAGIYPLNKDLNTGKKDFQFYTNVIIKDIGCDPSTIGIGKSFILLRNTYNFTLRNINLNNDTFDELKYGLIITDNSYTGSIENCEFPKVYLNAKLPWTITTLNFINLRSTFIDLKNSLGISFIQPVVQGPNKIKFNIEGCYSITIMNGDIEDAGTYLNFLGKNSNVRSFGNNILALKGKYTDGVLPDRSYFDDTGYIGFGAPNFNGKMGKMMIYNTDVDVAQSNISVNKPTINVEGNESSVVKNKYTYTSSENGEKTWGTVDQDLKVYNPAMILSNNGNLIIGNKKDSGEKLQVDGVLNLNNQITTNDLENEKPVGYFYIIVNSERVKIPYYK